MDWCVNLFLDIFILSIFTLSIFTFSIFTLSVFTLSIFFLINFRLILIHVLPVGKIEAMTHVVPAHSLKIVFLGPINVRAVGHVRFGSLERRELGSLMSGSLDVGPVSLRSFNFRSVSLGSFENGALGPVRNWSLEGWALEAVWLGSADLRALGSVRRGSLK